MAKRMIVIGAGPIGLEAALLGVESGFDVTVLEKDDVGASIMKWGSTRFFSPFAANVSSRVRSILGSEAPAPDALLTGEEFVRRVLKPIASRRPLLGLIKTGHRVLSIGRARMTRSEMPSHPLRAERPFKVIAVERDRERALEAEVVLDASGVYDKPRSLGAGGTPAIGERRQAHRIIRHLGELESALLSLANKRVLLVGHGHSAANAILVLEKAARSGRGLQITWATKTANSRPCVEVASDPLPERSEVVARANQLAADPPAHLRIERRAQVESVEDNEGAILVRFTGERSGKFDAIVSLTGYRPDLSFLSELALEISPVSEGTARIQRALANVTDCLNAPKLGSNDLLSGEPGFHMIGIKSYGRMPTFLLESGIAQLETVIRMLKAER